MKKFVELIKRVHQERFSAVISKIVAEKIPVAFLSIAPLENSVAVIKNLRDQGINITNLITISQPPPHFQSDFTITPLGEISKLHPRPKYIFALDMVDVPIAIKFAPDSKVLFPISRNTEHIYETFMNHLPELQSVYEALIDEESRRTFYGYWLGSISAQFSEFVFANAAHYFTAGFIPEPGAIVIDGGVCDGCTAVKFVNLGCKVYGFELDKNNFELAKKRADEEGFVVENLGLGSRNYDMKFSRVKDNIGASHLDENGTETARIVKLDTYVGENKIPRVDFIKLDVEGAELDVLRGAACAISCWKPILLISAYHKPDDLWTLMNFVKSIRPDYEFALRHYTETREDLPFLFPDTLEERICNLGLEPDIRGAAELVLLAR